MFFMELERTDHPQCFIYITAQRQIIDQLVAHYAFLVDQELATQRVEQRVAITLLRLVRQFGKRVDDGVLVDIPLSRQDLAEMTGTNLFNVSRILSKWEQDGVVRSGRRKVVLLKAHELVQLIEGDP